MNNDDLITDNIYSDKESFGSYFKRMTRIHKWFKYLLLVPGLSLCRRVLGKHLVKDVPDKIQYRNIKLFDDAFEKSLKEWSNYFLVTVNYPGKELSYDEICTAYENNNSVKTARLMKEILNTVNCNDTAYLELMNIFMFNLYIKLHKHYDGDVNHLFYTSKSIVDINYFIVQKKLDKILVRKIKSKSSEDEDKDTSAKD